ncbi:hypothetical protein M408DRAFT_23738 [Serendipita vermifera MAFF 305830]|uniref:Nephrocystin 3-like N-terminal domain-containing protein n=1 Tax=Serendipita vermifera MAFF 305830 TaxID=933852 RepID=A0A0C3BA53_SERVB|nr:hypothetical protein M408DRAFT_23738 [Serendipita vermifera MAFF 305830]
MSSPDPRILIRYLDPPPNSLLESSTQLKSIKSIKQSGIRLKMPKEEHDSAPGATLSTTGNVDILSKRLSSIDNASYNRDQGCMEGTRTKIINDTIIWATEKSENSANTPCFDVTGMLWIYGMPGIGKSAIAHSICRRLDDIDHLGGSFFCRRDDPARSEIKSVLPTLIYGLAKIYGPYGNRVAQILRDDPQMTQESASGELFLSSLQSLRARPLQTLVLVIDALDECGDLSTRRQFLEHLLIACQQNKWLKSIVISRPESDIRSFFNTNRIFGRDIGQEDHSHTDIRCFAMARMKMVAEERQVTQHPEPWVGERQLGYIVNRSGGLFIFVETLSQYLLKYRNPKPPLNRLLEGPSEEASIELHKLYLAAMESRVNSEDAETRLISRAVIGAASHRALCDEAIAALTGVEVSLVSSWVDDLSSLLYRDPTIQRGIRVRHISILEYLIGPFCPLDFRVDVKQADVELSMYTLQTLMRELRFNICGLETSYLPNSAIENLPERVRENISNILQYSSLYWFSHLCSNHEPASDEIYKILDTFLSGECFLYWLEVLSMMGEVPTAIVALRKIIACVGKLNGRIATLAMDALRFVLAFLAPISTSAPHIYLSALPFTPSESSIWTTACKSFPKLMTVSEGRMTKWPRIGDLWKGHTERITGIAYSPDGLNVVSCSHDKTVRIWDVATGAPVGEPLKGHACGVKSIAYSPDGRTIVSGSWDKTIRIWDAATGTPIGEPLIGHTSTVMSVAYSPDGHNIVSGSEDSTIRIWDAATGAPVGEPLKGHDDWVESVVYSPDGGLIVSGSSDKTLRVWDAATGAPMGEPLQGHSDGVKSVAYSPNGQSIISGSWDKTIRIWDAVTRAPIGEQLDGHTEGITSVTYTPNGQRIISGSYDKTLRLWDAATRGPVGEPLQGHTFGVESLACSPDGQHIVSGSSDKTIRMWDVATGKPTAEPLTGHTQTIMSVAYSPDGQNIVTGSGDCTIRIWDANTGVPVNGPLKAHTNGVRSVAYSPDSRKIVSGGVNNVIRIWDAATGAPLGEPLKGHTHRVDSVAYSPDGQTIVSGSYDKTIRIWDAATGVLVGEPLKGHRKPVASVVYSPDSQRILSGSADGTIQVWDAATRSPIGGPLTGHTDSVKSVAYSPDGKNIVSSSSDRTVRIWDAATRTLVGEPLKGHTNTVSSVAYSPDGRAIVSGSWDNTIRIWDAATGAPVGDPLRGHVDFVKSVAYSPDGRFIVSGSFDHTIRIWDAQQILNNGFCWVLPVETLSLESHLIQALLTQKGGFIVTVESYCGFQKIVAMA